MNNLKYKFAWIASENENDETGRAVFKTEDKEYTIKLECFSDFMSVYEMLGIAYKYGKNVSADVVEEAVCDLIKVLRS